LIHTFKGVAGTIGAMNLNSKAIDMETAINNKTTEHFSLDYLIVIKRLPSISDKWQIQNGIVVNFHYDLL
jgi:Hpt domain.